MASMGAWPKLFILLLHLSTLYTSIAYYPDYYYDPFDFPQEIDDDTYLAARVIPKLPVPKPRPPTLPKPQPPVVIKPPPTVPVIPKPPVVKPPPSVPKPPITKPPPSVPKPPVVKPPPAVPNPPIVPDPPVIVEPPPVVPDPPVIIEPPPTVPASPPFVNPPDEPRPRHPSPPRVNPPFELPPPVWNPPFDPPAPRLTCPVDSRRLEACVDVAIGVVNHLRIRSVATDTCCPLLEGLLDWQAANCMCATLAAKHLNTDVIIARAQQLLVDCGKNPPANLACPSA